MRNDTWDYGGPETCGSCKYIERGTQMMHTHNDDRLCDVCWDELPTCGVCGDSRINDGDEMCATCKAMPFED